jgi:hypothetical protein
MPDLSHGASELDARLAEIDRKLRAIQVDLDPDREPRSSRPAAPAPESSEPEPALSEPEPREPEPAVSEPEPRERPLEAAQAGPAQGRSGPLASLLQRSSPRSTPPRERAPEPPAAGIMVPSEIHAKLVSAMRDLLDAYGWTLQQLPVAADPQRAGDPPPVAMSVGPFADTAAVRAFEAELLGLPGVREVVLRGYEGENRAMFDVQLSAPNA